MKFLSSNNNPTIIRRQKLSFRRQGERMGKDTHTIKDIDKKSDEEIQVLNKQTILQIPQLLRPPENYCRIFNFLLETVVAFVVY